MDDHYLQAKQLFQNIANRNPDRLDNILSYDFDDPQTWLTLAQKAEDHAMEQWAVSYLLSDQGRQKIQDHAMRKAGPPGRGNAVICSFLSLAIANGDFSAVDWIIDLPGTDLNTPHSYGSLPMENIGYLFNHDWHRRIYEKMLRKGADFNHRRTDYNNTPLHTHIAQEDILALFLIQAAEKLNQEAITANKAKPYSFDLLDSEGKTPLRMAVIADGERVTEALLQAGADPNRPDAQGVTPLHCACARGNPRMVSMLLRHGANLYATDKENRTPFDYLNRRDLMEALLRNVNIRPDRPYDAPCNPQDFPPEHFTEEARKRGMAPYAAASIRKLDPPKAWPQDTPKTLLGEHCLRGHEKIAGLLVAAATEHYAGTTLTQTASGRDKIFRKDLVSHRDEVAGGLYHTHQSEALYRRTFQQITEKKER